MATSTRDTRDRSRRTGAYTAGDPGGRRKRGGWLWWLLGLLALLLLGALLLGMFDGGNDAETQSAQPTPSAQGTTTPSAGTGTAGGSPGGSLTARGETLLPVPAGGLTAYETETATGSEVTVQSVVKDEGFWVGSSAQDRVYVEYGGDVGANESQGFEPAVGDRVNLTGPVRPAPRNPARTLNLNDRDARQVTEQGAYINADEAEIM
jgi:hypothetical protein